MLKTKIDLIVENIKKAFENYSTFTLVSVNTFDIDYKWELCTFEIVISFGNNPKYTNHYLFRVDLEYYSIRSMKQHLIADNNVINLDYIDTFDIDIIFNNVRNAINESEKSLKDFEKDF